MDIRLLVKSMIASRDETIASIERKLGIRLHGIRAKLLNRSLKYTEAIRIADALGYDIDWVKKSDQA